MRIVEHDINSMWPGLQGDVAFVAVSELPKEAVPSDTNIVAFSETGHHHVAKRAQVFTTSDAMVLYLKLVGKTADVVHERDSFPHETLRLKGGKDSVWAVCRQREWVPEGWRQIAD